MTSVISDSVLGSILKVAPGLANAVIGPLGGPIVSMLSAAFGLEHTAEKPVEPAILEERIKNDPDSTVKLKQLSLSLAELEVKRADIDLQNQQSARTFNLQAAHGWVLPICAVGYAGIFSILLLLDALRIIDISDTYVQDLYTIALIIVNYYFGASFKKS